MNDDASVVVAAATVLGPAMFICVIVMVSGPDVCSLRSGSSLLVSPGVHDVAVVSLTPGSVQLIHLVVHMVRLPDRAGITPVLLVTAASCEG